MPDETTEAVTVPEGAAVAAQTAANPFALLQQAILHGNLDVDVMERLQAMAERHESRLAQRAWADAMAKFQSECPVVVETRENQGTRSKYASRVDIERTIRPIAARHGLSHTFDQEFSEDGKSVTVVCWVRHRDGHAEATRCSGPSAPVNKGQNALQGVGNAIEYLRRYSLCSAYAISTGDMIDNDGAGGDDHDPVTDQQLGELTVLANEALVNDERSAQFYRYMGVESLDDITRGDYAKARNALNAAVKAARKS